MAKTAKKTESGILGSVHKTAAGLHRAGVIDQAAMHEFDALCLAPVTPMAPAEIKALREREQVSQPVFASYLNVRKDAVSKWERGEKRPDGPSLKLLNLVKTKGAGFSRQVQHLMFSRNASAGVLYPRHFLGVELTAHVISSISRAV